MPPPDLSASADKPRCRLHDHGRRSDRRSTMSRRRHDPRAPTSQRLRSRSAGSLQSGDGRLASPDHLHLPGQGGDLRQPRHHGQRAGRPERVARRGHGPGPAQRGDRLWCTDLATSQHQPRSRGRRRFRWRWEARSRQQQPRGTVRDPVRQRRRHLCGAKDLATGLSKPVGLIAVDLDGDGKQDLVSADLSSDSISVPLNHAAPVPSAAPSAMPSQAGRWAMAGGLQRRRKRKSIS